MTITGIHHCSIIVTDMERAVKFYREVLQLRELTIPPTFVAAGMGVRWFEVNGQQIHLIPSPAPDTLSPRHFALHVDDAQAARRYFNERGVEVRETVLIPGADRFFIADPDSNRIEIIQWM